LRSRRNLQIRFAGYCVISSAAANAFAAEMAAKNI